MFSSKIKESASLSPLMSAVAAQPRRALRTDHAPSIISGDLVVNGALTSSGDMQIDGRVEGDIRSAGLVIGEKAEIRGQIYAEDLIVRGKVFGCIRARKVQLCATSRVEGDILHEAFAVESGAFFEGNIRHSDNPLGDNFPDSAKKPAAQMVVPAAPPPAVTPPPRGLGSMAALAPLGSAT